MRKQKLFFLLPALAFFACSKDPVTDQTQISTENQATIINDEITEIAFPDQKGKVSDVYYTGMKLPVENVNGKHVYQGDILLPKGKVSKSPVQLVYEKGEAPTEKSTGRTSHYWPENTVYYEVDGSLGNSDRVYDAIRHWESNTNVQFVKRSGQSNYVYFTPGSGCSSYIGMIGGKQDITLADACTTGNVIHEIGHSLGLWHEQSRADRDSYITIHFDNIKSGREYNFETYVDSGYDGDEFTSKLDFGSIMMYSAYAFSANGEPTITKKDGSLYSAQRSALSSGDIQGINSMYGTSSSGGTETNYINGEYYTIAGLTVLRSWGLWYYYSDNLGWREVKLTDAGYWTYA
ncbi:MAG: M12 family metallopeptidase [Christiangramia sp.]|uniref:M12 family metallopeptidase n=1 Tax=Christiangramia sp. TaxID=1931228 RepID=UPI0032429716